jgi:hypothetical protein
VVLSRRQISVMRSVYDGMMQDTCSIYTRSNTLSSSGQPVASWALLASGVECGFEFSPYKFRSREITSTGGGEETSEILVRCRLPISYYSSIDQNDRIVLTDRFDDGDYPAPETYEIQGFLERGPAGLIVNLKRVEA